MARMAAEESNGTSKTQDELARRRLPDGVNARTLGVRAWRVPHEAHLRAQKGAALMKAVDTTDATQVTPCLLPPSLQQSAAVQQSASIPPSLPLPLPTPDRSAPLPPGPSLRFPPDLCPLLSSPLPFRRQPSNSLSFSYLLLIRSLFGAGQARTGPPQGSQGQVAAQEEICS